MPHITVGQVRKQSTYLILDYINAPLFICMHFNDMSPCRRGTRRIFENLLPRQWESFASHSGAKQIRYKRLALSLVSNNIT